MTFAGLDVHARSTHAAAIDVRTGELRRARFGAASEELIEGMIGLPLPRAGAGALRSDALPSARLQVAASARPRLPGADDLESAPPPLARRPALRRGRRRARLPGHARRGRRPGRAQGRAR